MARRLALLALLAFAGLAVPTRPLTSPSQSSDSFDLVLWDDYEESFENSFSMRQATVKPNKFKVTLKVPNSKFNVSVKSTKSGDKANVIKTTINFSSYTNIVVTNPPASVAVTPVTPISEKPYINLNDQQLLIDTHDQVIVSSTNKTIKKKVATTRRPPKTSRPRITTTVRRQQTPSTRRSTTKSVRRTVKTTKVPNKTKAPCSQQNNPGWISSYFQNVKIKKSPKKEENSGLFSKIYSWFVEPALKESSWFGAGWFEKKSTRVTTTTTPIPPSTSTGNWFQEFLDSEDTESASTSNEAMKKSVKKSIKKTYKGYQLLRAFPDVQWKVNSLLDLQEEAEGSGLMWWTLPSLNGSTDLLVPPDLLVDIKDHLKSSKIEFEVVIWDLQKAIVYENPKLSKKQRLELEQIRGHPMTWRRYHRYVDILRYLDYLQHSYSDIVELVPLGRSSEGLPLMAVKISAPANKSQTNNSNTKEEKKKWKLRTHLKPAVWVEGGAHAREWIGPAVATWMIHNLVEGDKGTGADHEMLKLADFYIMPVMNPDGYEHSHTHDRLWRKTRSRSSDHADDYYVGWFPWNWGRTECVGVDADRNWNYHWGEKDSSKDPCADNYAGPHPFSEPETRAVSKFLTEHKSQIKLYISLHAYSQAWLLPEQSPAAYADDGIILDMAKLATAALADMFGTKYQVGTAADIRQPASGMSHDWAKARAGIKFSYHVDLRDSFGPYGFLLPGSQIVPTAKETWQAVKAIIDNITP